MRAKCEAMKKEEIRAFKEKIKLKFSKNKT